jgi:hypothetical protein
MPEALIRVTDKVNTDFYRNCKCTKRGDVIDVELDGWLWGRDELTLPFWRIIKFPIADPTSNAQILAQLRALLTPELPVDPLNPSLTLQRRGFFLFLDNVNITGQLRAYLLDDTRAASSFTFTATVLQIQTFITTLTTQRPPITDPGVLGGSPAVIG